MSVDYYTGEIVDAEIVPTKMEAVASIERAIAHAEGFWAEVLWQVENKVWESLNYESFDALWEHRYARLGVRISRDERPALVAALRSVGQTQQAVANKLGVNQASVSRDLNMQMHNEAPAQVENSRGQQRPATYKKREKPEPEALSPPKRDKDSATVALINDLRGPWRKGITRAAKNMNTTAREHLIATLEETLREIQEMQS